jgi:hypothetical protein
MNYSRSILRKIKTARGMPGADWGLLIRAWIELLKTDLLLRTRPFPDLQQRTAQMLQKNQTEPTRADWAVVLRYQRLVNRASRNHLYPMTCLRQALALQMLLAQAGIAAELRIGARQEAGQIRAHAWVEVDGKAVENKRGETEGFATLEEINP